METQQIRDQLEVKTKASDVRCFGANVTMPNLNEVNAARALGQEKTSFAVNEVFGSPIIAGHNQEKAPSHEPSGAQAGADNRRAQEKEFEHSTEKILKARRDFAIKLGLSPDSDSNSVMEKLRAAIKPSTISPSRDNKEQHRDN